MTRLLMPFFCAFAAAATAIWLVARPRMLGHELNAFVGVLLLVFLVFLAIAIMRLSASRRAAFGLQRLQPAPAYEVVAAKLDQIEAEMRKLGLWQEAPLRPEQYQFRQAFAGDTMSYDQWLQFTLIPRVKEIIANRSDFPAGSETAPQAVREFDGRDDSSRLQTLLYEFDRLFCPDPFA